MRAARTTSCAGLGQAERDAPPDAEPGPGDDGHLVVEAEALEDHDVVRPRRRPGAARPATNGMSR